MRGVTLFFHSLLRTQHNTSEQHHRSTITTKSSSSKSVVAMPQSSTKAVTSPVSKHHVSLLEVCASQDHGAATAACEHAAKASGGSTLAFTAQDPAGWTPLLYAARSGWSDVAQHCLDAAGTSSPNTMRLSSSGNTGNMLGSWGHSHLATHTDAAAGILSVTPSQALESASTLAAAVPVSCSRFARACCAGGSTNSFCRSRTTLCTPSSVF